MTTNHEDANPKRAGLDTSRARPAALALSLGLAVTAVPAPALAQTYAPETYSRLSVSLGGNFFVGNVNQIQANLQGNLAISSPTFGVDVQFDGYRIWRRPSPTESFELVGDDAFVNALPFWYFVKRAYVIGLGRFEVSQNQRLDRRVLAGTGLGFAPVRSKDFLIRAAVAPAFEYSQYDGTDFRLDVPQDDGERTVMRLALMSNGWLRTSSKLLSLGYIGIVLPNLRDHRDVRLNFDGRLDIKIIEQLAFRVTQVIQFDAATLRERQPFDIRSTFGLAWTTK